jgi:hypothetical protein
MLACTLVLPLDRQLVPTPVRLDANSKFRYSFLSRGSNVSRPAFCTTSRDKVNAMQWKDCTSSCGDSRFLVVGLTLFLCSDGQRDPYLEYSRLPCFYSCNCMAIYSTLIPYVLLIGYLNSGLARSINVTITPKILTITGKIYRPRGLKYLCTIPKASGTHTSVGLVSQRSKTQNPNNPFRSLPSPFPPSRSRRQMLPVFPENVTITPEILTISDGEVLP